MTLRKTLLIAAMLLMANGSFAQFAGGSGTANDPWQIATALHLDNVRNYLGSTHSDKHFIQIADIELGVAPWNVGEGWVPIGASSSNAFTGRIDGDNHIINGLSINRPNTDNIGLFGYTSGAIIEDVILTNASVIGRGQTGILSGCGDVSSIFNSCDSSGSVTGYASGAGGLVGAIKGSTLIIGCHSTTNVWGTNHAGGLVARVYSSQVISCSSESQVIGGDGVGSLIGAIESSGMVSYSHSSGSVTGTYCVGGLLGYNGASSAVLNCFSSASVGGSGNYYGGLLGLNEGMVVTNSFSIGEVTASGPLIGGLLGGGAAQNSYWNTQTSGQSSSSGGEGRTTAEMSYPYAANTYRFWDFERIWAGDDDYSHNNGYPYIVYTPDFIVPLAIAPSSGIGTEASPYQIESLENLYWISVDSSRWNKHYVQTADIDASQTFQWGTSGWSPIGSGTSFTGSYNGNGHSISGIYVNRPSISTIGFFGSTNGAMITNLHLVDVDITGDNYTGALVGYNNVSSVIENCSASGSVIGIGDCIGGLVGYNGNTSVMSGCASTASVMGSRSHTGGLVGFNENYAQIINCSSNGTVNGRGDNTGGLVGYNASWARVISCSGNGAVTGVTNVGGLIGHNHSAYVSRSISTGTVTGSVSYHGGLVGFNQGGGSLIDNCYSRSQVTGVSWVGGLTGANEGYIINSFSTGMVSGSGNNVGGLNGAGSSVFINSYWNTQTSGQSSSSGGEGRTTAEMSYPYAANTYRFWDFERIWASDPDFSHNDGYPYIVYTPDFIVPVAIAPSSGSGTEASPYQIASLENLYWISVDSSRWNKHYVQTANIDASQTFNWGILGWQPIGSSAIRFTGSYDGNGHYISSLYINQPLVENIGMFGFTSGAMIENLILTNASVTGGPQTGILAGFGDLSTIIKSCYTSGSVIGLASGAGGLVGVINGTSVITNCHSTTNVWGTNHAGGLVARVYSSQVLNCSSESQVIGGDGVGGLIGANEVSGLVSSSHSSGSVTGTYCVGGLLGYNGASSEVADCFSTSPVSGNGSCYGGLVGYNACLVLNSFSIGEVNATGSSIGGLLGTGSALNSYWNTQTSGLSTSSGGEGRTTAEMTYPYPPHSYVNWDWMNWIPDISSSVNSGYPYLYWQHANPSTPPQVAITPVPTDAAATITGNTILSWQGQVNDTYSNLFTGFKLWLGTDNPPTNLVNGVDLGRVFSYDPNPDLAINTTYYWKVVPYNPLGEAVDCPIWSFTTYAPVPHLTYPNGAELWMSNTTRQIRWAPNAPPLLKLYISFNNGSTWNSIGTTDGASGIYHYQVPAQSSSSCRIKITNASDETYQDLSDATFSISTSTTLPKLMLSYPSVSGLHLGVGLNENIGWTRQNVSLVGLDYSPDNGLTWIEIAANLNTDSFIWPVPDYPSGAARIRVRSMQNSDVCDISDNAFRVNKISVYNPNEGEMLTGDHSGSRKYLIRWFSPYVDNVKIEYSANGGSGWATVTNSTPASPSNYLWTIPAAPTSNGLIRISNETNPVINDQSAAPFIVQNPIRILNANGDGFITNTSLFNIRWLIQDIETDRSIQWEYSPNNSTWTRINQSAVAVTDQYMTWYVDTGLQNTMWLRAVEAGANYIVAKSEASFCVTDKLLQVQTPAAQEVLGIESYTNITWHAEGCTNLIIEYTTDFGQSWLPIASNIPSTQMSYLWQIPNTPSHQCRIRLRDMTHSYMQIESEAEFSIVPMNFTAAFSASPTIGYADLEVQFTDESIGYVSSWEWDFDADGTTDSQEQNPVWIFRRSGFHTVTLTISDGVVSNSVTRTNYIYVYPMTTDFSATPTSGYLPLTVQFSDLTNSTVTQWQWDFDGDGVVDSEAENPVWTYLFPGSYSVSLDATNGINADTEIKSGYVTASLNPATTLYVPNQYPTIQAAVNAASDGAYVIIANGIYYENVVIEGKNITLASFYLVDGDSTHIANTIIDGGNALNPDQASTLSILPGSGRPVTRPHIVGFTIQSGSGRRIVQNQGESTIEKRVGGGVYIRQANPMFSYNRIEDNDADDEGGGSYAFQSLPNHGGMVDPVIGLFNPGGNYFANNQADIGADIYIDGITQRDPLKFQNCSFAVISEADTTVSNYWVNSSAALSFSGSTGRESALNADLYVATNGSDTINSGLTPSSPFKTIDYALSRIYATSDNPLTIHIASGTYSPSLTGEKFPLQMVKHVSLQGSGTEETFLDAEGSADFPRRVLNLDKVTDVSISDLTLMNGFVTTVKNYNGGGIGIINSTCQLSNLLLAGSSSAGNGAGLYAFQSTVVADSLSLLYNAALGSGGGICSSASNLLMSQARVLHNTANKNGGGVFADGGTLSMSDCEISQNQATGYQSKGGGISLSNTSGTLISANRIQSNNSDLGAGLYLQSNQDLRLDRNRISNNLADFNGGGLFINTSTGLFTNNLLANNTASQRGGGIYSYSAPQIFSTTIANNKAGIQGGGIYLNAAAPDIKNSILWGNVQTSPEASNQLYLYGEASDPNITFCSVQNGLTGIALSPGSSYSGAFANNIASDPLFSEPSAGAGYYFVASEAAFSLQASSPCVDHGDPNTDAGLYPLDLTGYTRIANSHIDVGAYETVHYDGAFILASAEVIDFGRIQVGGLPASSSVTIFNNGNQNLLITSFSLETTIPDFSYQVSGRNHLIPPGASISLDLSFAPSLGGERLNKLLIHNNSSNAPIFCIDLSGLGIDASTSYPSNVQLQIQGRDVHLSWNPVISDPQGNPFTPGGYLVLFSENPSADPDDYLYLCFTENTSTIHSRVTQFRSRMFYMIIAMDESTWSALEQVLGSSDRSVPLSWREIRRFLGGEEKGE